MAYIINSNSCECFPNYSTSTFLPCCNAPVVLDSTYQARHFQEVYYAPEPAPEIQVVRQRLPDPPPDVIERVVVVPQPKKYVYQVVEVPTKPPPVVQQRVVHQAPNPTLCGGTYRVQVPHGSVANAPKLVQSASYMQGSPLIQQAPISYGSPSFMTL
ncbi:unnamed protein product [Rotaria socialis]|uniref:Uncharacterized protein n=1 Tax=Rotaria socialis TaxID=392032 RepID=A0A820VDQ9_9BILA|nr:unnamed protein product [Rotaria socialis]